MNDTISRLVFTMLLVIHGAHVALIGVAGLAGGNMSVALTAAIICIAIRLSYRGILRRYA